MEQKNWKSVRTWLSEQRPYAEDDTSREAQTHRLLCAALDDMDAGREWMRHAWNEFNSIRARDGAPAGVSHEWWSEATDALGDLLRDDTVPWMLGAAKKLIEPYQREAYEASAKETRACILLKEACEFISEERDALFQGHQVNGDLVIECESDQQAADAVEAMDTWLERAAAILNGGSIA